MNELARRRAAREFDARMERLKRKYRSMPLEQVCREVRELTRRQRASTTSEEISTRTFELRPVPDDEPKPAQPPTRPTYYRVGPFGTVSFGPGPNASFSRYSVVPRDYMPPKKGTS
jgi:hypothetical protein